MAAKSGQIVSGITDGIGHLVVLIDPEKPWQKRAEAGFAIAAIFAAFLPQPFGVIGREKFITG